MLIHRVFKGEFLVAVRAGEAVGRLVASDVFVQFVFRLGTVRTVGAVKRPVTVLRDDVAF
jgi:hypothetical protein